MKKFWNFWDVESQTFKNIPFDADDFFLSLDYATKSCPLPSINPKVDMGFIMKKDIPKASPIFIRSDIQGDLLSLLSFLEPLKGAGILDDNYHVIGSAQLVFLGDYAGSGGQSLQVLHLLAWLKAENPSNVLLLRGDGDCFDMFPSLGDPLLFEASQKMSLMRYPLEAFFATMPLTLYLAEAVPNDPEYIQCTHSLLDIGVDPTPLLAAKSAVAYQVVPKECPSRIKERISALSARLEYLNLQPSNKKIAKEASAVIRTIELTQSRLNFLTSHPDRLESGLSAYNLMYLAGKEEDSRLGGLGTMDAAITAADVKQILRATTKGRVKMIFRGHSLVFLEDSYRDEKVFVSTLPSSRRTQFGDSYSDQVERAYVLTTAAKVKNWSKQILLHDSVKGSFRASAMIPVQSTDYAVKPHVPPLPPPPPLVRFIQSLWDSWDSQTHRFSSLNFDHEAFHQSLSAAVWASMEPDFDASSESGFIIKENLSEETQIFVRADLHGDLLSLLYNLKTLQHRGLLDKNYKATHGARLVFLGDYTDRGPYSLQVLQILALLKAENPDNVYLVRGNHEYVSMNLAYGDRRFQEFLTEQKENESMQKENESIVSAFYDSLPLTVYLGQKGSGKTQYAQFTHGLFDIVFDPSDLLDDPGSITYGFVPKESVDYLEDRIRDVQNRFDALQETPLQELDGRKIKQMGAAKKVSELLISRHSYLCQLPEGYPLDHSGYNWMDVAKSWEESRVGCLGMRDSLLSPEDVKRFLRLQGKRNQVKMVFRGHSHEFAEYSYQRDKGVFLTTLPVAMNSVYKSTFVGQVDRAYILKTAEKVRGWSKTVLINKRGVSGNSVSRPIPLHSYDST